MKFKKLATILVAAAVALGGISVAPVRTEAAQVTVDGYSYSSEVVDALNHLNGIRANMGLQAVKLNPFLTKAAENHANYIVSNGVTGHTETTGNIGFTGIDMSSRLASLGYSNSGLRATEVICYRQSNLKDASLDLIESVYHRVPFTSVNSAEVGFGIVDKTVTILFSAPLVGGTETAMYPYNGQTNVPTLFDGLEDPNPLTQFGLKTSGYPISISKGKAAITTENSKATLVDSLGRNVDFFVMNDTGALFLIPKNELKSNETYTASVSFTPSYGTFQGQTFNQTWSFTTAASSSAGGSTTTPDRGNSQPTNTIPATGNGSSTKYSADNIAVRINQAIVSVNPKPILKSGSTFIPLRGVLEKLGASLTYNAQTKGISIIEDGTTISLTIGSTKAFVNGKAVSLSSAPFVNKSGSTFVPLRFVSQALGASVAWDQKNYIVSIDTK
ncbi:hypothetical protein H1230_25115 [Paenibacillus sp. 19GGS1-52]|uniref:stalk domain-containing protein n=1 Tax=Paenibacillus sp. 19GGS1-52 TaxID=2758563 RepID=UPI001EFB9FF8|nr:stalk domain-containing protein [Paenibacillus sp. 19GGS1-52]ULO06270.1 hypothetical protein H1230_25115 [Paenibacillus sp. 19GGS1-52]